MLLDHVSENTLKGTRLGSQINEGTSKYVHAILRTFQPFFNRGADIQTTTYGSPDRSFQFMLKWFETMLLRNTGEDHWLTARKNRASTCATYLSTFLARILKRNTPL